MNLNTETVLKIRAPVFFSYFVIAYNGRGCSNQPRSTAERTRILCSAERSRVSSRKTNLFRVQEFTVSAVICTACCSFRSQTLSLCLSSVFRCSFVRLYDSGCLRQYADCDKDWTTGQPGVCFPAGEDIFLASVRTAGTSAPPPPPPPPNEVSRSVLLGCTDPRRPGATKFCVVVASVRREYGTHFLSSCFCLEF
jgi:hypothetical protein